MAETQPRYEYRAWAGNFAMVEEALEAVANRRGSTEGTDTYLISAATCRTSAKLRDGTLDIKVMIDEAVGLEQWRPILKGGFPLRAPLITGEIFAALALDPPPLARAAYTADQFLDEVARRHPRLVVTPVFKRRFKFALDGCRAERVEVRIGGAAAETVETVAVESADQAAVRRAIAALHLDGYSNVSYVAAIKQVIGLEPRRRW